MFSHLASVAILSALGMASPLNHLWAACTAIPIQETARCCRLKRRAKSVASLTGGSLFLKAHFRRSEKAAFSSAVGITFLFWMNEIYDFSEGKSIVS